MSGSAWERTGVDFFFIMEFGATGDGHTIDTPAVDKAIDAAAASGGRPLG